MLDKDATWNETMSYYSQYPEKDIIPVVHKLASVVVKSTTTSKLKAIQAKYSSPKFMKISTIKELDASNRLLMKYNSMA